MKPGTAFFKMTGSGNDFLVVDGRAARLEDFTPRRIAAACDRRLGIGADGVILLDPEAPAGTHFTFHFWNSDGSPGPMCGNGALCATRVAAIIGLAPEAGEIRFVTPAGIHVGRVLGPRAEIRLPNCTAPEPVGVGIADGEREPMFAIPSVPHLVLQVADVGLVDLARRGPPLRSDPALPPGGANVNWVSPAGDGSWKVRTYERGVEGETLACGTGSVACALALEATAGAVSPIRIWTTSGRPLDISWERRGSSISSIRLEGDASLAFTGVVCELPS